MVVEHQIGDIIGDRFRLTKVLGQGGTGITYAAIDERTQQQVALKALSVQQLQDWKTLELFEREAQTLKQLDHPQIPDYIDYVQIDKQNNQQFYLAQQLVEGQSLAELVSKGWRPSEVELKNIAQQVLGILTYLHSLVPPVIHRDIKPKNLIRKADGTIMLVDFGAIQNAYQQSQVAGSTFVGTYGYMAPEQCRGRAQKTSDLYGLGGTLLYLHTGESPADFPEARSKINFRSKVNLSRRFANWLEGMLEPVLEDRFQSAEEALKVISDPYTKNKTRSAKDISKVGTVLFLIFTSGCLFLYFLLKPTTQKNSNEQTTEQRETEISDRKTIKKAKRHAQGGEIADLREAIAIARNISSSNPRYRQAQELIN